MRILLTNDDGITSPGITLLATALREAGHRVFTVAPDSNRSGCSHSINFLWGPQKLKKIEDDTFSCSGTPVDCVIIALLGGIPEICISKEDGGLDLEKAPDLVLSGLNAGANLGTDIVYSGTAAAARQGSFFGIPSVALSLVDGEIPYQWDIVIPYIQENLGAFMG
jgi:5'-nucleotidase